MTPRNTPYRKPSRFAPRQDRWALHKMYLYAKGEAQRRIGFEPKKRGK